MQATKDQINDFLESFLWKDMRKELLRFKRDASSEIMGVVGNCINNDKGNNSASVMMDLGSIYGRVTAIDYLLMLPEMLLSTIEEKTNES